MEIYRIIVIKKQLFIEFKFNLDFNYYLKLFSKTKTNQWVYL